jgi:hypothetical protein
MPSQDKLYIAYCTSGLGNRLRPLASAIAYCELTGRRLRVYWDNVTPNGCLTPLDRLFQTPFDTVSLEELHSLGSTAASLALFTEKGPGHSAQREAERFGRDQLLRLSERGAPQHSQALTLEESADVVVVYDNDFLASVPRDRSIAALRNLVPDAEVRAKVVAQAAELGLWEGPGKPWQPLKGVHARGTDFGVKQAVELYGAMIRERVGEQRFFLSTEDSALEQGLREAFPGQVISRNDRLHLTLNDGKQSWTDPDSYTISVEHGLDALTDIYLLSCVDLVVFHPGSTFAEISRHLNGVLTDSQTAFKRECTTFIQKVKQLVPRGDAVHRLDIETGLHGPKPPEEVSSAFMYWETLGYQIPFMERLFMNSFSGKPVLKWDGAIFNQMAAMGFDNFPRDLFPRICPYPEAWSQMAVMRGYMKGKKVLVVGSETFWVELLCALGEATEITTVEYRPIEWTEAPKANVRTLTWDDFINDLEAHRHRYDLVVSYSSIEHSGLGRYGDRVTPLGDLLTFYLMARCMKPNGLCTAAVPTGQDLTHFNAHRIYGEKRIRAMQHVSGLTFIGIAGPDAEYLSDDAFVSLRAGWTLPALAQLPLGQYRQPILCFARTGFTKDRYASA